MADNVMTYRMHGQGDRPADGVYATFMPKPIFGQNGSGMHVHQSLFKGSKNAFFDARDKYHLSAMAKYYIAGLLKHAREITAVTNQWVNSYKRLVPGYEAPVYCRLGPAQPLRPGPRAHVQARQGRRPPASSSARPIRPATPTWPSPSCWPPA